MRRYAFGSVVSKKVYSSSFIVLDVSMLQNIPTLTIR